MFRLVAPLLAFWLTSAAYAGCVCSEQCETGFCNSASGGCVLKADGEPCNTLPFTCEQGKCVTPLIVDFVRVRPDTNRHRAFTFVHAHYPVFPAQGDFGYVTQGVAVRIQDALHLDRTFSWSFVDCYDQPWGGLCHNKIGWKILLPFRRTDGTHGLKTRQEHVDIHGPLKPPFTITLYEDGGVMRRGTSGTECLVTATGIVSCLK